MADGPRPRQAAHPTPLTYLKVAVTLAVLTAIEVGVFYIDVLEPAFLAIFLILSVFKFCLVVLFFMHLKFDSRLFSGLFVGGLMFAVAVIVVLLSIFQVLSASANPKEPSPGVVAVAGEPEEAATPTPTPEPATTPTPGPTAPPGATPTATPTTPTPSIETPAPSGPDGELVAQGRELYLTPPPNVGPQALWCYQCHKIEGVTAGLIGPDHTHLATEAATRVPGLSAAEYIRESIIDPEKRVAEGVKRATPGLMTKAITEGLTDGQVAALVAFLLEQR